MNPSTAFATVVVDELIRNGVREAVVAPGSRSAPWRWPSPLRTGTADFGYTSGSTSVRRDS